MNFSESNHVSLDTIDAQDFRFRLGLTKCSDALLGSLREVGQLYPVLVKKESDKYIIIDGHKRVSAARILGIRNIRVLVSRRPAGNDLELFLYHVHTVLAHQPLNELEKADMFMALTSRLSIPLREFAERYAPLGDLTIFPRIGETCKLISELPETLRSYIHEKNIRLQTLGALIGWDENSAYRLLETGKRLQLGANKLKQLCALTLEISRRDSVVPSSVLKDSGVIEILENAAWTDAQKWEKSLNALSRMRYPEWTGIEAGITGTIRDMKLPDSVSLRYPEFLEGDRLTLTMTFRSEDELRALSLKMNEIADSEELQKILRWIKS